MGAKSSIGCDIDIRRLEKAKALIKFKALSSTNVIRCDLEHGLPFADKTFDVVVLSEVIEHIMNQYLLFKEMHRVIRNEGFLIISTPNPRSIISILKDLYVKFFKKTFNNNTDHKHELTKGELLSLLRKADFEIKSYSTYGFGLSKLECIPLLRILASSSVAKKTSLGMNHLVIGLKVKDPS